MFQHLFFDSSLTILYRLIVFYAFSVFRAFYCLILTCGYLCFYNVFAPLNAFVDARIVVLMLYFYVIVTIVIYFICSTDSFKFCSHFCCALLIVKALYDCFIGRLHFSCMQLCLTML